MTQYTGKTALVTGSGIRLGKAIALDLAQAGYNIAIHYHSSEQPAQATAQEIRKLGVRCETFQHTLNDADGLDTFLSKVIEMFPDLSVVVNSASVYDQAPIAETTLDLFNAQFDVNLRAPYFLTQAFANQVGTGNVINIIDNKIGFNQFHYAAYLLSKKTLAEFTKLAALEFAPKIRVNGVAPGVVLPASVRSEEYVQWRVKAIPLQKQGNTSNISQMILHILENDFLTGQIFVVDGGENIANIGLNAATYED